VLAEVSLSLCQLASALLRRLVVLLGLAWGFMACKRSGVRIP
jgi:hypothetical protein